MGRMNSVLGTARDVGQARRQRRCRVPTSKLAPLVGLQRKTSPLLTLRRKGFHATSLRIPRRGGGDYSPSVSSSVHIPLLTRCCVAVQCARTACGISVVGMGGGCPPPGNVLLLLVEALHKHNH